LATFNGFSEGKTKLIRIPNQFFTELLGQLDDLVEIKIILFFFWYLESKEGPLRYLRTSELLQTKNLFILPSGTTQIDTKNILEGIHRLILKDVILEIPLNNKNEPDSLLFLNSSKGRAVYKAYLQGKLKIDQLEQQPNQDIFIEQPNIYQLYEENVGPLTPLIADSLREMEASYPQLWIEESIQIAVDHNIRNLKYIQAVLRRWQEEGRNEEDRGNSQETRRKYIEGEYSDFIEH
jgi:DNA replication protein